MAQLIELSLDCSKINKKKLKDGKYLKLTVSVNDDLDNYKNDVSAYEAQTEDERKAKEKKNFLGNGKTFWANGGAKTNKDKAGDSSSDAPDFPGDDDDLPF